VFLLFRDLQKSEHGGAEVGVVGDITGNIHLEIHCSGVAAANWSSPLVNPRLSGESGDEAERYEVGTFSVTEYFVAQSVQVAHILTS
jgi:hypothetical protein